MCYNNSNITSNVAVWHVSTIGQKYWNSMKLCLFTHSQDILHFCLLACKGVGTVGAEVAEAPPPTV